MNSSTVFNYSIRPAGRHKRGSTLPCSILDTAVDAVDAVVVDALRQRDVVSAHTHVRGGASIHRQGF